MKFSKKEMTELLNEAGEIEENKSVNVFHCKHGRNNNRCYITNKGTAYVFYCHHCHKRGALPVKLSAYKRATQNKVSSLPPTMNMPYDCEYEMGKWPVKAKLWPLSASLDGGDVKDVGMGYSEKLNRVCIPVTFDGKYRGYVARRIGEDGPKYLAKRNTQDEFIFHRHNNTSGIVVLVEDLLSVIKLSKYGYNAVALQGTEITDTLLNFITSNYSTYIIWMDNDNPQVKMKQAALKLKLSLYGTVKLIKTDSDPKIYSKTEFKKLLED